ncbi:MAG: anti-sigma factor family protein [Planctomycetota bacterium]
MKLHVSDELISAYLDGELNESQREQVEAALAADENLRQVVRELQLMRDDLRSLPSPQLDDEFVQRVLQRTLSQQSRQLVRWRWAFVGATTVAASFLFLLAWGSLPLRPQQVGARFTENHTPDRIATDAHQQDPDVMGATLSKSAAMVAKQQAASERLAESVPAAPAAAEPFGSAAGGAGGGSGAGRISAPAPKADVAQGVLSEASGGLGGGVHRFVPSDKTDRPAAPGLPGATGAAAGAGAKSAVRDQTQEPLEPLEPLVIQVVVAEKDWPRYVESVVAHFNSSATRATSAAQRDALARQLDRKRVPDSSQNSSKESSQDSSGSTIASSTVEQPVTERWFRLQTDSSQRLANELTELIPEVQVAVSRIEAPRAAAAARPIEAMTQTFLLRERNQLQSKQEELKRAAGNQPAELAKAANATKAADATKTAATESVILVIRAGAVAPGAAPSARPK